MIGGPQFLSHMAYIASPDRLKENDPPTAEHDSGAATGDAGRWDLPEGLSQPRPATEGSQQAEGGEMP